MMVVITLNKAFHRAPRSPNSEQGRRDHYMYTLEAQAPDDNEE